MLKCRRLCHQCCNPLPCWLFNHPLPPLDPFGLAETIAVRSIQRAVHPGEADLKKKSPRLSRGQASIEGPLGHVWDVFPRGPTWRRGPSRGGSTWDSCYPVRDEKRGKVKEKIRVERGPSFRVPVSPWSVTGKKKFIPLKFGPEREVRVERRSKDGKGVYRAVGAAIDMKERSCNEEIN